MIVAERLTERLDALFEGKTSTIARDLKLNLKRLLGEGALAPEEAALTLAAVSTSVGHKPLAELADSLLAELGISEEQRREAVESAALMGMLNTYYSFRGKLADSSAYGAAGLRMTALARPALGKERFEMLAFAVSVINGCSTCITSHEQVLADAGVSVDKRHDLARLAAVVKGLQALSL